MSQSILEDVVEQAKGALGPNLRSLVLYGSHARGEAGKGSDINLFMVVSDNSAAGLEPLKKLIPVWARKDVAAPVVFREDQLARAFDSFAIEFAEMAASRRVLAGSDPFGDFNPDWEGVRTELEREARQKDIALRRRWLASGGNTKHYPRILAETVPGYLTLLRCMMLLEKRAAEPTTVENTLKTLGNRETWFKPDLWRKLRSAAKGLEKPSSAELEEIMKEYLDQAAAIVRALDEMP